MHDFGLGPVFLKIEEVSKVRPPETVYGLVIIAYDVQIAVFFGKKPYKSILAGVDILELIYQNVFEPVLIYLQNVLMFAKYPYHLFYQVVEIKSVLRF